MGRQRVLLEIVTFLYFAGKQISIPMISEYATHLVSMRHNFTEERDLVKGNCMPMSGTMKHMRKMVMTNSALLVLLLNVAELTPTAITVLFLGWWSDYTKKRKMLLWLPCLGNCLQALGFMSTLYLSPNISYVLMFVGTVFTGISGNLPGFMSGNACYISDTDSEDRRTTRLSIVEFSVGITFALCSVGVGIWVQNMGFLQPFAFMFGCSAVALLLIIFCMDEPRQETSQAVLTLEIVKDIRHRWASRSSWKLWVTLIAFGIFVFVQTGQERTFTVYMANAPLCWNTAQIGYFLLVLYALSAIASYPGILIFQKCCGDTTIFIVSLLSKGVGSMVMAFADGYITAYVAAVVGCLQLLPYAIARSLASKQVGPDEQGTLYALVGCIQAALMFLGPVIHNALYAATLKHITGLVFIVSGAFLVIPVILLGLFQCLTVGSKCGYRSMDGQTEELKGDDSEDLSRDISTEFSQLKDTN